MKKTQREWKADVKRELTLRGWKYRELAEASGYKPDYVGGIVAGTIRSQPAVDRISAALSVEPYEVSQ